MARFNLDEYETVETRLGKFWGDHPEGRVITDLIAYGTQFVVRAEVYFDRADERPVATGYAEEQTSDRGVNQTSALENCETSAIGRALANCGYATKGKRPSREEMAKVERGAKPAAAPKVDAEKATEIAAVIASVTAIDDTDALRSVWMEWESWLDAEVGGTTLKAVILARKAALEAVAA